MRVLLTGCAERTTLLPLVPLAWGLRTAGHDVLMATQPAQVDLVARAGLPVAAVGRDHQFWRVMHRVVGFRQEDPVPPFGDGMLDPERVGWPSLLSGYRHVVPWWWRLVNEPMLDDLVDLCRRWRPDVVIWETVTFAGGVAARAVGAASVRFVWSADVFARMRRRFLDARPGDAADDPLAEWLGGCARRFGVDFTEGLVSGDATVTCLPPPLRRHDPGGLTYLPTRFVPCTGRSRVPAWLREPPPRPRVCVTLGTTASERFGGFGFDLPLGDLLAGLAELDVEIVATVPDAQRGRLGTLPDRVRLESFVPLDALMPTCAAVVNHGGPGTVLTAVTHGVPQVVIPAEFDAPLLARLLAGTGAALALPPEEATPTTVGACVRRVLTESALPVAAATLRTQARSMPDVHDLADGLVNMADR
ncbi:MAG: nucleotide disphospho-sugar-binding domain-containing protein [Kineosporiaceae bacterium]